MFLMMLFTSVFGQDANPLHRKYDVYYSNSLKHPPLNYGEWLSKKQYVDANPSYISKYDKTHRSYSIKQSVNGDTSYVYVGKSELTKKYEYTPGNYLIKAKNQILAGIFISIAGTGIAVATHDEGGYVIGASCGVIGLIFGISGIANIGKAGVSLNSNGITVKF